MRTPSKAVQGPEKTTENCYSSPLLIGEHNRLDARDLESLPAAHILAGHQVVLAQHVGAGLGETSPVSLVGASGELPLFSSYHPSDFVFAGLMAVGTI
jgi:hypothetical protein